MTQQHFAASHYEDRAEAYVQSAVHATGPDLDEIEALLKSKSLKSVLDLGCGGGHVSYRAAKYAARVVACDVTPGMLGAVSRTALDKGLTNIETRLAAAESLPFELESFDAVLCRFTAHHWTDFKAGIREARRVVGAGTRSVFVDTVAPNNSAFDTHLQAMELLRDPSHVRNYTISEWCGALAEANFMIRHCEIRRLTMEFQSWVKRTATPDDIISAVLKIQKTSPEAVKRYFNIQENGNFELDAVTIVVEAI